MIPKVLFFSTLSVRSSLPLTVYSDCPPDNDNDNYWNASKRRRVDGSRSITTDEPISGRRRSYTGGTRGSRRLVGRRRRARGRREKSNHGELKFR